MFNFLVLRDYKFKKCTIVIKTQRVFDLLSSHSFVFVNKVSPDLDFSGPLKVQSDLAGFLFLLGGAISASITNGHRHNIFQGLSFTRTGFAIHEASDISVNQVAVIQDTVNVK